MERLHKNTAGGIGQSLVNKSKERSGHSNDEANETHSPTRKLGKPSSAYRGASLIVRTGRGGRTVGRLQRRCLGSRPVLIRDVRMGLKRVVVRFLIEREHVVGGSRDELWGREKETNSSFSFSYERPQHIIHLRRNLLES